MPETSDQWTEADYIRVAVAGAPRLTAEQVGLLRRTIGADSPRFRGLRAESATRGVNVTDRDA